MPLAFQIILTVAIVGWYTRTTIKFLKGAVRKRRKFTGKPPTWGPTTREWERENFTWDGGYIIDTVLIVLTFANIGVFIWGLLLVWT